MLMNEVQEDAEVSILSQILGVIIAYIFIYSSDACASSKGAGVQFAEKIDPSVSSDSSTHGRNPQLLYGTRIHVMPPCTSQCCCH